MKTLKRSSWRVRMYARSRVGNVVPDTIGRGEFYSGIVKSMKMMFFNFLEAVWKRLFGGEYGMLYLASISILPLVFSISRVLPIELSFFGFLRLLLYMFVIAICSTAVLACLLEFFGKPLKIEDGAPAE